MADHLVKYHASRTDETAIKELNARIQHVESQMESTTNAFIQAVAMSNEILQKSCDTKIKELQTLADDLKTQRTQLQLEQGAHATKSDTLSKMF